MDLTRLNGIISAIQEEAHNPFPSHLNLARLTGMALVEIREIIAPPVGYVALPPVVSSTLEAEVPKKKVKKSK